MVKINYILLFDNDLISRSILTFSLQILKANSHIYHKDDNQATFNLLESIAFEDDKPHEKVTVIVDLNLEQNKGYVFLDFLFKNMPPYPIKVYTIKNEFQEQIDLPHIPETFVSGQLEKPLSMEEIKRTLCAI